jgi:hypothetical protein
MNNNKMIISERSKDGDYYKNRKDCSIETKEGNPEYTGKYMLSVGYLHAYLLKEDMIKLHKWIEENVLEEWEKR